MATISLGARAPSPRYGSPRSGSPRSGSGRPRSARSGTGRPGTARSGSARSGTGRCVSAPLVCCVDVDVVAGRIVVDGELDCATADRVGEAAGWVLDRGARDVTVSLAGVTFGDSALVDELAALHRRLAATGHLLTLADVPPKIARLIRIAGAGDLL